MPIRALPGSPGYMFASWPAAPPVFEAVARPSRLCVPMPIRSRRPAPPSPATDAPTVAAGAPLAGPVEGEAATLAPMPGRALGPCAATLTSGRSVSGIEFEPSPDAEPDFLWTPFDDARALGRLQQGDEPKDLVEFIERLRAAGVNANRHASPDLLAQLHQAVRRPIDTVVCAALDTDPSACLNAAMVAWYGIELAAGMLLLSRVSRAGRAVVAVDARVPSSWLASLRSAGRSSSLRVEPMVNDYPQADPTLMLYTLLNRRLRPGRLPSELGVIQVDAATAVAVGRCALVGGPVLSWPLVVRDHVLRQSFFLFAPGGMRLGDVLEQSRVSPASALARGGDVLRDVRLPPGAVVGGGGELVVHVSAPEPAVIPDPCVRCGWCAEACPTRLQPAGVLEASQREDVALAESYGVDACIECGICAYVCPSRLPLLEGVRRIRAQRGSGQVSATSLLSSDG